MFVIDKGERKLIKRKLLDENGNIIPWSAVEDVRFRLMSGGKEFHLFSKGDGNVTQNGDFVQFELTQQQTKEFPPTNYQLLVALDVYDSRFTDLMTDKQWETWFMRIRRVVSQDGDYSGSVDEDTIRFGVIPDGVVPQVQPVLTIDSVTDTSLTASHTTIENATGYEYRLNGGTVQDTTGNPFTVTGIPRGQAGTIEVRVKDGLWSDPVGYELEDVPTAPQNVQVDGGDTYADVTYNAVEGATGYKYRIDLSSKVDVGNVTNFRVDNLQLSSSYAIEVLAYDEWGDGYWSETVLYETTVEQPVISDGTITVTDITDEGATFGFTKATDPNTVQADLIYKLYTGNQSDLSSRTTIESQTLEMTATDVNEFILTGKQQGESLFANVVVENEAGVISIYDVTNEVFLLDPSISSLTLTSEEYPSIGTDDTHQIETDIVNNEGASATVLHEVLNGATNIVTVDANGLITPIGVEGQAQVRSYSDYDNSFEVITTITVYTKEFESNTNQFETQA